MKNCKRIFTPFLVPSFFSSLYLFIHFISVSTLFIRLLIFVCRKRYNAYLRKWVTHSEVVKVLELKSFEPYGVMQRIIEETPNPAASEAICFGFKVKKLS